MVIPERSGQNPGMTFLNKMLEVGEIRYNVQEKVEVFGYIFHNLS